MKAFVRSLSDGAEFTIVIVLAFGLPLFGSFLYLYGILSLPEGQSLGLFSTHSLYKTVLYELVLLSAITVFLRWRGWRLQDIHPEASLKLTFGGVLLVLVYYTVFFNLYMVFSNMFPSVVQFSKLFARNISKPDGYSLLLMCVINPVFEESIVAGYVITALKEKKGVHFAVNVSVAIRLLYHLYQGPLAAISIIPMGLMFAYVYVRTERLWPLIVAHAIQDFIALSGIMG